MTEKKNPNPFINLANQAKKNNAPKFDPKGGGKTPKPSKGFGGPSVIRRSGRGG